MARPHDINLSTRKCRNCYAPLDAIEDRFVPADCIGALAGKQGYVIIDEFAFFGGSTIADSDGDDGA